MRRENETTVRAMRFCEGGESVSHGRTASMCSFCSNGICISAQACEIPEPEPAPAPRRRYFPTTPEGRARLIGGTLGLCGAVYIAAHVLRYLQLI